METNNGTNLLSRTFLRSSLIKRTPFDSRHRFFMVSHSVLLSSSPISRVSFVLQLFALFAISSSIHITYYVSFIEQQKKKKNEAVAEFFCSIVVSLSLASLHLLTDERNTISREHSPPPWFRKKESEKHSIDFIRPFTLNERKWNEKGRWREFVDSGKTRRHSRMKRFVMEFLARRRPPVKPRKSFHPRRFSPLFPSSFHLRYRSF